MLCQLPQCYGYLETCTLERPTYSNCSRTGIAACLCQCVDVPPPSFSRSSSSVKIRNPSSVRLPGWISRLYVRSRPRESAKAESSSSGRARLCLCAVLVFDEVSCTTTGTGRPDVSFWSFVASAFGWLRARADGGLARLVAGCLESCFTVSVVPRLRLRVGSEDRAAKMPSISFVITREQRRRKLGRFVWRLSELWASVSHDEHTGPGGGTAGVCASWHSGAAPASGMYVALTYTALRQIDWRQVYASGVRYIVCDKDNCLVRLCANTDASTRRHACACAAGNVGGMQECIW